jgi:hypothetical protein
VAAAVVVAGTGLGVGLDLGLGTGGNGGGGFQVAGSDALSALGGRRLAATALRLHGREVGQVFVYAGRPSWVFMTVDTGDVHEPVTCELQVDGGATVVLGSFSSSNGYQSWGSTVAIEPSSIRGVRLVSAAGAVLASASLTR